MFYHGEALYPKKGLFNRKDFNSPTLFILFTTISALIYIYFLLYNFQIVFNEFVKYTIVYKYTSLAFKLLDLKV